jgi:hypothetical protein
VSGPTSASRTAVRTVRSAPSTPGSANARRQQRLERARLFFPDDAVGREGNGGDDWSDEKQKQELLQQEGLRRGFDRQRGERRLYHFREFDNVLEVFVGRKCFVGQPRDDVEDEEWESGARHQQNERRHERARACAQLA